MGILCFVYFLLGCVKTVWTQLFWEWVTYTYLWPSVCAENKRRRKAFPDVIVPLSESWNARSLECSLKHHRSLYLSKYVTFSLDHSWKGRKYAHLKLKGLRFRLTPICFLGTHDMNSIFHVGKVPKEEHLACSRTEKGRLLNSACWQWLIYLSRRRHMLQLESFSHTHCSVLLWVVCMLWASPAPRQKHALGCIMALWSSHPVSVIVGEDWGHKWNCPLN